MATKLFNTGKRKITSKEGDLLPGQKRPYLIQSDAEAAKLMRLFPDEISGIESAAEPFRAEGAAPSHPGYGKAPKAPAPRTSADIPRAVTAPAPAAPVTPAAAALTATAPAPSSAAALEPVNPFKAPADPAQAQALAAANETRLMELMTKPSLSADERNELASLQPAK